MLYDDPLKEFINLDVFQSLSDSQMTFKGIGSQVVSVTRWRKYSTPWNARSLRCNSLLTMGQERKTAPANVFVQILVRRRPFNTMAV